MGAAPGDPLPLHPRRHQPLDFPTGQTAEGPNPEIDSLAPLFEAANWVEREIHELLGINFRGHPDMRRLLLSDDWPQGVYPLRQDYQEWDPKAIRDRGV